MLKKILSLFLSLSLIASLVACGGQSTNSPVDNGAGVEMANILQRSSVSLNGSEVTIDGKTYNNQELANLAYDYLYNSTILSTEEMIRTVKRIQEITSELDKSR